MSLRQPYYLEFEEGIEGHRHIRHNLIATAAPTTSDNADEHYAAGSLWVYGTYAWQCIKIDPYTGDADWQPWVSNYSELEDVYVTGLAHGDIIQWSATNERWEPLDFLLANLDEVDFETTAPSVGDVIELDDTPSEGDLIDNAGVSASGTADDPTNILTNDSNDSRFAYNEYVRYDFGEAVTIWSVALTATYPYSGHSIVLEYSLDGSTAWTAAGTAVGSGQSWTITCTVNTVASRYWRVRNAGATERLKYVVYTEALSGEYWRPVAHDHSAEIAAGVASHEAETSSAHVAEGVDITDAGGHFTGTEVETALQELGADSHAEDHAARHASGGADAVKLDDLAAPEDNTDLNASTSAHGLLPKLSGTATEYLDGSGAFSTPPVGAMWAPLMDGYGNVVTDAGTGAAIMAEITE